MEKADTFINYMIDMEATGKNIRNIMKITGYTARELERLIGCTQMTFFNWQEGKNLPSFDNLLRLSGILKTPMEKIVVFKKFQVEDLPLKETNSGFVRNNVFFTYNKATECVIRDCMTFKKKFGSYPDKIILNSKTLENWQTRESEELIENYPANENYIEAVPGKLLVQPDDTKIVTDLFTLNFVFDETIPEDYYRLIKSDMCKIQVNIM